MGTLLGIGICLSRVRYQGISAANQNRGRRIMLNWWDCNCLGRKSTYADFGSLKSALEVLVAEKPHLMEEN